MRDELQSRRVLAESSPDGPGDGRSRRSRSSVGAVGKGTTGRFGTRRAEANGLDAGVYAVWRWAAVAEVVEIGRRLGLSIREVYEAPTGSVYVRLKRLGARGVRVRISDHRSHQLGPREFSVRHRAPGRLAELEGWLRRTVLTG